MAAQLLVRFYWSELCVSARFSEVGKPNVIGYLPKMWLVIISKNKSVADDVTKPSRILGSARLYSERVLEKNLMAAKGSIFSCSSAESRYTYFRNTLRTPSS